ncbi:hypothetical protein JQK87_26645, partial [Streptomyces sp. G44]|nr:hypothetical protein [Streptomyces sp. G44]
VFAVLAESPGDTALACGPALVHALPLLWRRRAPWAALCVVLATAWLVPLAVAFGIVSPPVALCLAVAGGVTPCVAVHAVGAFAGPARVTWPAVAVGAAGLSLSSLALAAADGMADLAHDGGFGAMVFMACALGVLFLFPLAAPWAIGAVVRARRERVRAIEDHALTETVRSAVFEAYEERRRIAAELRGEVVRHASGVVARAEAGDLRGVAEAARSGLSAMRDLLATLRETTDPDHAGGARGEAVRTGGPAASGAGAPCGAPAAPDAVTTGAPGGFGAVAPCGGPGALVDAVSGASAAYGVVAPRGASAAADAVVAGAPAASGVAASRGVPAAPDAVVSGASAASGAVAPRSAPTAPQAVTTGAPAASGAIAPRGAPAAVPDAAVSAVP